MNRLKSLGLVIFLFLASCATTGENPELKLISRGQYENTVESSTKNAKIYDGFMNLMDVSGTLLNSRVTNAQLDQNARIYQWSTEQYQLEKSKIEADLQKQSDVFLSFFVPEKKHDDLNKTTTRWKIFLDAGGRRYEGKATRVKTILAELQFLYPHHTRWSTPYKITFPVPMVLIEKQNLKLILTGPVGSASLDFSPVQ